MCFQLHGGGDISQDNRTFGALDYTPRRVSTDSRDSSVSSSSSHVGSECNSMQRTSCADGFRISVSSNPSCSSQSSGLDDIESLGDVFLWGEIWSDGGDIIGKPVPVKVDVLTPKPLETNIVLDVQQIACGDRHIALVTRQGEVFTWGEESGGRLGHGIEKDFSRPRLIEFLAVTNIDYIACGEFHTGAVSSSGDLYTWGDGAHNAGLLGHGNDVSHWIPKRVSGLLEGLQVLSVACGTWHSAVVTSSGKLFTFGDGTFGALGHGDHENVPFPKEVNSLNGLKTVAVSCGVWHTAAIIEVSNQSGANVSSRKLFTWGDGDKYRLGHGNKDTYLSPTCVSTLIDYNIQQLACGHNMTIALTTSGHVFSMGNNAYGSRLVMRKSDAAIQRAHVEKAKADAIARADKKAKEKAEAEAKAKAKEDKPKLNFLCNFRGCNTKDENKKVISDHWSVKCAHGKKNHGPFFKHCGNQIRENDPCRTYGDDHCPRKKHVTNAAKRRTNDEYALQRQLREEEEERKARNRK